MIHRQFDKLRIPLLSSIDPSARLRLQHTQRKHLGEMADVVCAVERKRNTGLARGKVGNIKRGRRCTDSVTNMPR